MVKIEQKILHRLTDTKKERNIYTHPIFLARDIFWQRLEYAFKYINKHLKKEQKVLDFGGGSGVFSKALASYFNDVSIIDLDTLEAENIKNHFNLENVTIHNQNINDFKINLKYDVIVATDVLEHFLNLNEPLNFFNKFLKKDGFLLITLPTENKLYEFGRLVINKKKPIDHYHSSEEVISFLLQNNFELIENCYVPKYIINIPLFEVAILKFNGEKQIG